MHEPSPGRAVALERLVVGLLREAAVSASERPLPLFQLPAQVVAVALARRVRHGFPTVGQRHGLRRGGSGMYVGWVLVESCKGRGTQATYCHARAGRKRVSGIRACPFGDQSTFVVQRQTAFQQRKGYRPAAACG